MKQKTGLWRPRRKDLRVKILGSTRNLAEVSRSIVKLSGDRKKMRRGGTLKNVGKETHSSSFSAANIFFSLAATPRKNGLKTSVFR